MPAAFLKEPNIDENSWPHLMVGHFISADWDRSAKDRRSWGDGSRFRFCMLIFL